MDKEIIKTVLDHPYKISAIKYFLRKPSLLFVVSKNLSKIYFLNVCKKILGPNFIQNLQKYQVNALLKKKFNDRIVSVQSLLFLIVKKTKPEIFVETGVAKGGSSTAILRAMDENNKGHLYSIDLPIHNAIIDKIDKKESTIYLLKDKQYYSQNKLEIGYLIPNKLKYRWELILGDSKVKLPKLLDRLGEIEIFFHDSLHTYEHMLFEFETAWPSIKKGGFLISHDVIWNKAFLNFSKKVKRKFVLYYSLGVIRK